MATDSEVTDGACDVGSVVAHAHSMHASNNRAMLKAMHFLMMEFL
jgi:hypothetical protein